MILTLFLTDILDYIDAVEDNNVCSAAQLKNIEYTYDDQWFQYARIADDGHRREDPFPQRDIYRLFSQISSHPRVQESYFCIYLIN